MKSHPSERDGFRHGGRLTALAVKHITEKLLHFIIGLAGLGIKAFHFVNVRSGRRFA
jgi:hypothetical protein